MTNAIEIKNLKFAYDSQPVLDIPSFTVREGEVVFLYGPSGSGKSTLLEILAGVLKLNSGELNICSTDLTQMSLSQLDTFRAKHVGYIFQSFNLVPYLTVRENIELPFLFQSDVPDPEELKMLATHLGLDKFLDRPVSRLSVGQQQRVAVARALIKKPKIILADEPTSALDYGHREAFLRVLFELCRKHGTTVVFVSHDLSIEKLFDRTVGLSEINRVSADPGESE